LQAKTWKSAKTAQFLGKSLLNGKNNTLPLLFVSLFTF
jgi:hypothetical protein